MKAKRFILAVSIFCGLQVSWAQQGIPVLRPMLIVPKQAGPKLPDTPESVPPVTSMPKVGDRLRFQVDLPPTLKQERLQVELAPNEPNPDPNAWGVEPEAKIVSGLGENPGNTVTITAIPLKPGSQPFPRILLKDPGTGQAVAELTPTPLEVGSVIQQGDPRATQPEAAEPPVGLPFPFWVVVAMAVLAVLLAAALIYGIVRLIKNRRAKIPFIAKPLRPEDEIALEALAKLEQEDWLAKGLYKPYYFRVSEIMKAYIGARYKFDALESTTSELLIALDQHWKEMGAGSGAGAGSVSVSVSDPVVTFTKAEALSTLTVLFSSLDQVKFSDYLPSSNESAQIVQSSRLWVTQTRKVLDAVR